MQLPLILFYIFTAIIFVAALRVITTNNPVHAVLFLVLAFFTSAGLWLMLRAEFLAIVLLLVYVGAVMVFFLFVVMMLNIKTEKMRFYFWRHAPLALSVASVIILELVLVLTRVDATTFKIAHPNALVGNNTQLLGMQLYTTYLLPFELAAFLLVLAMVAAIALTKEIAPSTTQRSVSVNEQVVIHRQDRLYKVNLKQVAAINLAASKEDKSC